jgi:hypothetical protein
MPAVITCAQMGTSLVRTKEGEVDANISVSIEVNEADGCLKLDSKHVHEEITNAVRATERT